MSHLLTSTSTALALAADPAHGVNPQGRVLQIHDLPESDSPEASEPSRPRNLNGDSEFDDEDQARGERVRDILHVTAMTAIFEVGLELSRAFQKFAAANLARGRNSRYGRWLRTYLRKTLDRWRTAYDKFSPLLEPEIRTGCLDFLNFLPLTTIYALCQQDVTDAQRRMAIAAAQTDCLVNKEMLTRILLGRFRLESRLYEKIITLPAGEIRIAINHDDFGRALQDAGSVAAAIWRRQLPSGFSYLDFSLIREYKSLSTGNTCCSKNFFVRHQAELIQAVQLATRWVAEHEQKEIPMEVLTA